VSFILGYIVRDSRIDESQSSLDVYCEVMDRISVIHSWLYSVRL